jgi:hypothetical protein
MGHYSLAVFVQKMEGLLAVLGLAIVFGGVINLEIHFQVSVSGTTLPKE